MAIGPRDGSVSMMVTGKPEKTGEHSAGGNGHFSLTYFLIGAKRGELWNVPIHNY